MTAAVVMLTAALPEPPQVVTFDRPFALAVADGASGAALFVGEVHQPEECVTAAGSGAAARRCA